jgi:hypothetical protein
MGADTGPRTANISAGLEAKAGLEVKHSSTFQKWEPERPHSAFSRPNVLEKFIHLPEAVSSPVRKKEGISKSLKRSFEEPVK